jgi:uncharacterized alkaline shock family protein YloU
VTSNLSDKKTPENETGLTPRQIRIRQLKEKLSRLSNQETANIRKQRNGQLIAAGVYIEMSYKKADIDARKKIQEKVLNILEGRNAERASAMFKRLDNENPVT